MIKADQPTIFGDKIIAAVSSIEDGAMKIKGVPKEKHQQIRQNRKRFLKKNKIMPSQTVLVWMSYESEKFIRYDVIQKVMSEDGDIDDHHPNDALATNKKNIALFLPIADCIGAILYDSKKEVLMVAHLGRHNLEQYGAKKSIEYMVQEFKSNPKDILAWMSPAAGKENYPLFAFNHKSLNEVAREQFEEAGIAPDNIESSSVDTTKSGNYHSYSEFLKGNPNEEQYGRFAIVAMMPA